MESNNSQLILSGLTTSEFMQGMAEQMRAIIKEEMKAAGSAQEERLLSPAETCKLFNPPISKVTLSAWTRSGSLQDHRIGSRVFYKQSEIMESLKTLKKYKAK